MYGAESFSLLFAAAEDIRINGENPHKPSVRNLANYGNWLPLSRKSRVLYYKSY